jgi:hypothetical protein
MEIEVRFDKSTLRDAVALCDPNEPVIVLVPSACPMAKPVPLVMNAGEAFQEATLVTSCWLMSLKVAVAVNCCCFPSAILTVLGLTTNDVVFTFVIVNSALFETPLSDAVITAVPGEEPAVTSPCVGGRLPMLAKFDTGQDHWTNKVRSFVLPSEYFPLAVNDCCVPGAIDTVVGLTWMDCRVCPEPTPPAELEVVPPFLPQPSNNIRPANSGASHNLRMEPTLGQ